LQNAPAAALKSGGGFVVLQVETTPLLADDDVVFPPLFEAVTV
jgi:hypothetical protein